MEERIEIIEKVIENLHKDVAELSEVVKMHIRSHIAEYDPVHVISMKGTTENGISYSWGSHYRAAVNKKQEVHSVESV